MKTTLILVALALSFSASAGEFKDKDISFQWAISGTNLNIKLSANAKGWVGVGFEPSKGMKDADFKIAYVKGGKLQVEDHFGVTASKHKLDTDLGGKSDITAITGGAKGDALEFSFTMPLNSGDANDKPLSLDKDITVLLAIGPRPSMQAQHTYVKKLTVNLKSGSIK